MATLITLRCPVSAGHGDKYAVRVGRAVAQCLACGQTWPWTDEKSQTFGPGLGEMKSSSIDNLVQAEVASFVQ